MAEPVTDAGATSITLILNWKPKAIYDLQESNGLRFLVLELVDGETLAERIQRGAIPIEEALQLAKGICDSGSGARTGSRASI